MTLDTVFAQTFTDYEVIVIDNGSTDNTHDLIFSSFSHPNLRYFRYEKNQERSWARNTGFSKALGSFATLLDSDDFIYPSALEDAHQYFLHNPETKVFHNLYELVDDDFNTIYRYHFPSLRNQHKAIATGNFLSCIGVYLHRDVYQHYRFDADPLMIGSEDYDLWLRILAEHKIGRIPKINSGIRHHSERSVNQSAYTMLGYQSRKLLRKISSSTNLQTCYLKYKRRIRSSFLLMTANTSITKNHILTPWQLLIQAIILCPALLITPRPYQTFYHIIKSQTRFML